MSQAFSNLGALPGRFRDGFVFDVIYELLFTTNRWGELCVFFVLVFCCFCSIHTRHKTVCACVLVSALLRIMKFHLRILFISSPHKCCYLGWGLCFVFLCWIVHFVMLSDLICCVWSRIFEVVLNQKRQYTCEKISFKRALEILPVFIDWTGGLSISI